MKERSFDEMIAYFNRRVSEMDIAQDCKAELLGMVVALGFKHEKSAQPEGCPYYIKNIHDRGDDSLCRLFHREVKYLAIETRQVGEWIDDNCSVCGFYVHHGDARNYCPNCGAKMEADNET